MQPTRIARQTSGMGNGSFGFHQRLRVLSVAQNDRHSDLMKLTLEKAGFNFAVWQQVGRSRDRVKVMGSILCALHEHWDAAIVSYDAPDLSGLEIAVLINGRGSFVPMIMLSERMTKELEEQAWKVGACALHWGASTPTFVSVFGISVKNAPRRRLEHTVNEIRCQLPGDLQHGAS